MNVLGLHKDPWHNTGAAIIREDADGVRFANLGEERHNREKDSRKFPSSSVKACMKELGIETFDDLDLIVMDYIVNADWRQDWYREPLNTNSFLAEVDPQRSMSSIIT